MNKHFLTYAFMKDKHKKTEYVPKKPVMFSVIISFLQINDTGAVCSNLFT